MIALFAMLAIAATASDDAIREGIELRKLGKNDEALAAFERAFELEATPRARAQIAFAEQALGRWIDAERDLELALAAAEDPWIEKNREVVERANTIIKRHLAWIDVTTNVEGVELLIEGVATSTLPARVIAGEVRLEARKLGFERARRTIVIAPNTTAREELILVPEAPQVATPALEPAPPLVLEERAPEVEIDRTPAWVAIGGGLVLIGAGVVASVVRVNDAEVWNDDSRCLMIGATREQVCGDVRDRMNAALGFQIGGFGLGGLAIALGATLLIGE